MNIVVYCSSASDLDIKIRKAAENVGKWIGSHGHTLVYGGVNAGLMHIVAEAVKLSGGRIIGVIPKIFADRADPLCDEIELVENISIRKGRMIESGDVFVVLPGGMGTIDEWVSTLSHFMLEKKMNPSLRCRLAVLDIDDIYHNLISQIEYLAKSPFGAGRMMDPFETAFEIKGLLEILDRYEQHLKANGC